MIEVSMHLGTFVALNLFNIHILQHTSLTSGSNSHHRKEVKRGKMWDFTRTSNSCHCCFVWHGICKTPGKKSLYNARRVYWQLSVFQTTIFSIWTWTYWTNKCHLLFSCHAITTGWLRQSLNKQTKGIKRNSCAQGIPLIRVGSKFQQEFHFI